MRTGFSYKNEGFTLIELAVVLVIGGIIMAMLFDSMQVYLRNAKQSSTKNKLEVIDNQLQKYLEYNGSYPCPAALNIRPDDDRYGFAVGDDCASAPVEADATFRANGVRMGAVPVRTLNLPDDFANDSWGNRINYAVTETLTDKDSFQHDNGAIRVIDSRDIRIADRVHYVTFSSGPSAAGAYTSAGGRGIDCVRDALDGENCDRSNAIFRNTMLTSDAGGNNTFDDMLVFHAMTSFGAVIPSRAVIGFEGLSQCPARWTRLASQPANAGNLLYCRKN